MKEKENAFQTFKAQSEQDYKTLNEEAETIRSQLAHEQKEAAAQKKWAEDLEKDALHRQTEL